MHIMADKADVLAETDVVLVLHAPQAVQGHLDSATPGRPCEVAQRQQLRQECAPLVAALQPVPLRDGQGQPGNLVRLDPLLQRPLEHVFSFQPVEPLAVRDAAPEGVKPALAFVIDEDGARLEVGVDPGAHDDGPGQDTALLHIRHSRPDQQQQQVSGKPRRRQRAQATSRHDSHELRQCGAGQHEKQRDGRDGVANLEVDLCEIGANRAVRPQRQQQGRGRQ